jgi:integrase
MVAKRALNDRIIKATKPAKPGQRQEIADAVMPGMVLRVTDKGTRTFALVARYPGSDNPTRRSLGEYPAVSLVEAREKARRWLALLEKGIDPNVEVERERLAEQRKNADTFAAVVEKFITRKLGTQRRGHVVERIIRKELLPFWAMRPVTDITHRDVRDLVERVVDRGAATYAHNILDAANAVLNFAAAQDMIEANPCRLLKRKEVIGSKKHRQRVLGDTEVRAFWRASGQLDYPFGPFYRLLLLTGTRLEELAGARWREFDLAERRWKIPAERFKSDAEHAVPLTDDVMAVLATLPRFNSGDYLFSTTFGKAPVSGFAKAKQRLDRHMLVALQELAELRGDDPKAIALVPFVNHDLRRTVRTRLSALKVQDHVAEMVIGHGRKGIARIYDQHRFEDEKREALTRWAMLLRSIVEPAPANVVELKATAR